MVIVIFTVLMILKILWINGKQECENDNRMEQKRDDLMLGYLVGKHKDD